MESFQTALDKFIFSLDRELEDTSRSYPYGRGAPREKRESIRVYRRVLDRFRANVQEIHNAGSSGAVVAAMLSAIMDSFILHLMTHLPQDSGVRNFAVGALGGYGRKELNPGSDIDIVFLTHDAGDLVDSHEIGTLLHFLADMNLNIGHSTRTVSECIEASLEDMNLATSLLDARFLGGNALVWDEFSHLYRMWLLSGVGVKFALDKICERNSRLARYHNTVKIQEPDIKESPGGLRDIHTARWLLLLAGFGGTVRDLCDTEFLYKDEWKRYEEHFDFLLRVRNSLHFSTGKEYDRLEHIILPDIAKNLLYEGSKKQAAERFMHDYYMHSTGVYRLTSHIIGRFLKRFEVSDVHDITVDKSGLIIIGKKVGIPSLDESFISKHPVFLIKIFAFAGFQGYDLSGYAASQIERNLGEFDNGLPDNPEVQREFRTMLAMEKGLGRALRLMHEHGVLVKLIPEFCSICWHYQYNLYHAYTTDEHSIRVVENLERMALGEVSQVPELAEIMAEVTARGSLYLAGLLHDTGKGAGSFHSVRGERMAAAALDRLGFDERTIKLVRFLIKEHLLMTHTSQRRDMEDDDTIKDFVRRVSSTGRLRMLMLLTFADLMAVSDTAFNDWKKALLINLYNKALMHLEKGYEKLISLSSRQIVDKVVSARGEPLSEKTILNHLKLLPEQYMRVTSPACIKTHIHGIKVMDARSLWTSFRHAGDVTLLTVIAWDKPRALSEICGTITASDISIVGAQIFTRDDGVIIDTFMVVDENGGSLIQTDMQETFKQNLRKVLLGEVNVKDLITTHTIRWKRRRRKMVFHRPRVKIYNDISTKFTVVDVFATNYTGLLYDVTSVLTSFGLDIHTAKVGTDEDRVADAFYVQKNGGGKVEDAETLKKLRTTLIKTFNKAFETK